MKYNFRMTAIVSAILAYVSISSVFATQKGLDSQSQHLSLHLALKEYRIFHAQMARDERIKLLCDQYHILLRKELWPLAEKNKNYYDAEDLAALSSEGNLMVVFNPKTVSLEIYDIDSKKLQGNYKLSSKNFDKFDDIFPISPDYMVFNALYSASQINKAASVILDNPCRLFLFSLADGKIIQLSEDKYTWANLGQVYKPGWNFMLNSVDNNANIYIHSPLNHETRVWRYNIASGQKEFLYSLAYDLTNLIFDAQGQLVFADSCIDRSKTYYEVDNALRLTPVFSVTAGCSKHLKVIRVFPFDKTLVLVDGRFTDRKIPVLYEWGTGLPVYKKLLSQEQADFLTGDVKWTVNDPEQPDNLVYFATDYDKLRIHTSTSKDPLLLDQLMEITQVTRKGPDLAPSLNFKRIIVSPDVSKGNNRLTVYDIDRVNRKITPFFSHDLKVPILPKLTYSQTTCVEIPAMDGTIMRGYLTLPHIQKNRALNLAAFVYVHGGPHARDTLKPDPMVPFLASRKIAVLQVNYPGSTGFGKAYENASDGRWDEVVKYIKDARDWLVKEKIADAGRIAIGGTSFGAYITVSSLQRYPSSYQCGVAVNGIYDLVLALKAESQPKDNKNEPYPPGKDKDQDTTLRPEYKNFDIARQFLGNSGHHIPQADKILKRLSPALNKDEINVPLLLLHATKDQVCPVEQAESLVNNHPEMPVMYGHFLKDYHTLKVKENLLVQAALTDWFLSKYLGTFSEPIRNELKIKTFKWQKRNF